MLQLRHVVQLKNCGACFLHVHTEAVFFIPPYLGTRRADRWYSVSDDGKNQAFAANLRVALLQVDLWSAEPQACMISNLSEPREQLV